MRACHIFSGHHSYAVLYGTQVFYDKQSMQCLKTDGKVMWLTQLFGAINLVLPYHLGDSWKLRITHRDCALRSHWISQSVPYLVFRGLVQSGLWSIFGTTETETGL